MKHFLILIILAIIPIITFSQSKEQYKRQVDSLNTLNRQNHVFGDTLWVLDSSLLYGIPGGSNELMLERKYEVLKRNDFGNVLVALNKVPEFMEPFFLNTEYDSITYFDGVNIKQHYSNVWNSVAQTWIDNKYIEYEAPELLKEEFDKKFSNGIQQYYYGFREMYDNSNGRADTMFRYNYNSEINSWDKFRKTIFYYDESGGCAEEITKQFDEETNSWSNYYMYIYSYNNNGDPDTVELKSWDIESNNWRDNYIGYFTYDASGRLIHRLQMEYNIGLQEMVNSNNYLVEYNNNKVTQVYQYWHMPDGSWENQYRYFFSYIAENKFDTIQQDLWNNQSEQWGKEYLTVSQYDNHENIFEEIYYRFSGGDWTLETQTDFYWTPFISNDIPEIIESPLTAYPNPASTNVTFTVNNLTQYRDLTVNIFNISGQKLGEFQLNNGVLHWDCSNIESGLYIYSSTIGSVKFSGKIIVR